MALSGSQIGRIHGTICTAYSRSELRRAVKICMDVDFDAITPDSTFEDQVFHLVRWADTQGRTPEFVRCAWENNPSNAELQALLAEVQGWEIVPPHIDHSRKPWPALLGILTVIAAVLGGVALWRTFTVTPPTAHVTTSVPPAIPLLVTLSSASPTPSADNLPQATVTSAASKPASSAIPSTSAGEITVTVRLHPKDGAEYAYVPPGFYSIGTDVTDPMAYENEGPPTSIYLDGFWIMRTEVTNAQYAACVRAQACMEPNSDIWASSKYVDYPVTTVTWYHAAHYAEWVGGYLPTEVEWEAACRGPEGWIFPWGNRISAGAIGNFGHRDGEIQPVGSYPKGASPFGVLDMAGNAWEWTNTRYAEYPYVADDGREDASVDGQRVIRGGSFYNGYQDVRCALRDHNDPFAEDGNGGFRVVLASFD